MYSHGTSSIESFKDHQENIIGARSSIIQAKEYVSDFSFKQENQESKTKVSHMSQHDELESCHLELPESATKDCDKEMCQILSNTGQLDRKSWPDVVGQSIYGHSNSQCNGIPIPATAGDRLPQFAGESYIEKGDLDVAADSKRDLGAGKGSTSIMKCCFVKTRGLGYLFLSLR